MFLVHLDYERMAHFPWTFHDVYVDLSRYLRHRPFDRDLHFTLGLGVTFLITIQ